MANQITSDEQNPMFVITYLFNDEFGPNFDYLALSADVELSDDFVSMAVQNPSSRLIGMNDEVKLPTL